MEPAAFARAPAYIYGFLIYVPGLAFDVSVDGAAGGGQGGCYCYD